MKTSLNTYKLYSDESVFYMMMRFRLVMKEAVDAKYLSESGEIPNAICPSLREPPESLARIFRLFGSTPLPCIYGQNLEFFFRKTDSRRHNNVVKTGKVCYAIFSISRGGAI